MTPYDTNRYPVLDGLRGMAALAVMLFHVTGRSVFPNVLVAVDLFFMLSGFVIAHSYSAKLARGMRYRDYVKRRLIRLYPMFLLGCVLGSVYLLLNLVYGSSPAYGLQDVEKAFFVNVFFLPYLNHTPFYEGLYSIFPTDRPSWSLFFELVANLMLLPLLLCSIRGLWRVILLGFVCLFLFGFSEARMLHLNILSEVTLGWNTPNILGGFPRVFYGFTIGLLCHRLWVSGAFSAFFVRHPSLSRAYDVARGCPFGLYFALLCVFALPPYEFWGIFPIVSLLACPLFVIIGIGAPPLNSSTQRISHLMGWLSYPVYCLHRPIDDLLHLFLPSVGNLPLLSCGLTLAVAVVSTKLYEEPLRAALSNRFVKG